MSHGSHLLRVDQAEATRDLAHAEAAALGARPGGAAGIFWCDEPPPVGRAAFAVGGGRLLAKGPPGRAVLPARPEVERVHVVRGPWRPRANPADLLAELGWPARRAPRSAGAPELYATPAGWFLVEPAPREALFAAPRLEVNASTSLPARLARAVVNLVARPGERLLDPVCGTGVLLVEALRVGCRARGADLSWRAVQAARRNLAGLGLAGHVTRRDALSPGAPDDPWADEPRADALVGDLPYGIRLEPVDLGPFAAALPPLARRWALVAARDLSEALARAGHPPRLVVRVPKPRFTRFVHVGGEVLGASAGAGRDLGQP